MPPPDTETQCRQLLLAAAYMVQVMGIVTAMYASPHYWTQDYHTSSLTGLQWVDEEQWTACTSTAALQQPIDMQQETGKAVYRKIAWPPYHFLCASFTSLVDGKGRLQMPHCSLICRLTDLTIPHGKFYLADAGFPSCDSLMVPYRGVRYHLKEWALGAQRCVQLLHLITTYEGKHTIGQTSELQRAVQSPSCDRPECRRAHSGGVQT